MTNVIILEYFVSGQEMNSKIGNVILALVLSVVFGVIVRQFLETGFCDWQGHIQRRLWRVGCLIFVCGIMLIVFGFLPERYLLFSEEPWCLAFSYTLGYMAYPALEKMAQVELDNEGPFDT